MGNPNGTNSSVAWGGPLPYKELRMKKEVTITQQTMDYVTMFRYVFSSVLPSILSDIDFNRSLEMDEVEQAQYRTITIRKPNESKRDYNARLFAEYHRSDLSKWL